jgi:Phage integrase, N-terminal SAM-like domain
MSEKPISPLRQRMLEDMRLRGFTPDTQRDYIRAVKKLAAFLGRSISAHQDDRCANKAFECRSRDIPYYTNHRLARSGAVPQVRTIRP